MVGITLGRYLAWRFTKVILTIFVAIFCLTFVIDFVQLLRRASDNPDVGAGVVALMSLLSVPHSTEMVLPFAVLFGAMATFVDLTRKLELVVARAAGVSVWQFLTPPLIAVFCIGVVSVGLYNPISAALRQRYEQMDFELFGVGGSVRIDHGVWLRQRGVDGLAIIHAMGASEGGAALTDVSANLYAAEGGFTERVEAERAVLLPGAWLLLNARVNAPGEAARRVGEYLLATDLTPERLAAAAAPATSAPFWALPALAAKTEEAGLDARPYHLQFHKLLARPLLLVAMLMLAAAFSLRFIRFGGVTQTLAGGVAAGFVLYIATEVFSDLGGAGTINPWLAAWAPALVGSMLGTLSLLHSEDG
jgi:lipopolysaccharide export system permease protein